MTSKTAEKYKGLIHAQVGSIHDLWHDWQDHFTQWYHNLVHGTTYKNGKFGKTKRKYRSFDITQIRGYQAMCRMKKYIETHPEIIEVGVDDSHYTGSCVYLIPHKDDQRKSWHGVTVLNVPQCSSDQNTFFLYPHHLNSLIKELLKLQKEMRVYLKEEKKRGED